MDSQIALSTQQYDVCTALVERALDGLDEKDLQRRIDGHSNCMLWLFAHLTVARTGLAGALGVHKELPWKESFAKGSDPSKTANYPTYREVKEAWEGITRLLVERFETLTDEELSGPPPRQFRIADKTLRGAIAYLAFHEAYHVGQMAYLRKCLGKESLVG